MLAPDRPRAIRRCMSVLRAPFSSTWPSSCLRPVGTRPFGPPLPRLELELGIQLTGHVWTVAQHGGTRLHTLSQCLQTVFICTWPSHTRPGMERLNILQWRLFPAKHPHSGPPACRESLGVLRTDACARDALTPSAPLFPTSCHVKFLLPQPNPPFSRCYHDVFLGPFSHDLRDPPSPFPLNRVASRKCWAGIPSGNNTLVR